MLRPRVAAIVTEYRPRSHADVIVGKLLAGYSLNGVDTQPRIEVASMYLDQVPENDTGREMAARYRVPIYRTIGEALTLGGHGPLVDGAILVGEHGTYPTNALGQKLYPRRRFFDATIAAMVARQHFGPIFVDKHLSWSFANARAMYDAAWRFGVPLLAGSSLPVTWRRPPLSWPVGTPLQEALAVGYGGIEAYGFHALETLQCMVERRAATETGVESVQCLEGDDVWEAGAEGRWSRELLDAALATIDDRPAGRPEDLARHPAVFLIQYRDGLRASVLMLDGVTSHFTFAARRPEGIDATCFWLESQEPFGHFSFLVRQIETMVVSGRPPYPAARTLLTTGILDAAMRSRYEQHATLETPELAIAYAPPEQDYGA